VEIANDEAGSAWIRSFDSGGNSIGQNGID
jgi:hypothetical protein